MNEIEALRWKLDAAVTLANKRQAEIDALKKRTPIHISQIVYQLAGDSYGKCSGCGGLFNRDRLTVSDRGRFCTGCLANEELVNERDGKDEQIRNQVESINLLEIRIRSLSRDNGDLLSTVNSLRKVIDEKCHEIVVWQGRVREFDATIDEQAEAIQKLEAQLAQAKAEASFNVAAPLKEAAAVQATHLILDAPSICWYRDGVPQGWSAGWLLFSLGPLMVVALQSGHLRWFHSSNVTTTEPEKT